MDALAFDINMPYTGVSGNIRINENADRLYGYDIWDYAQGQDSYQKSILVDLSQPPGQVCDSSS